MTAMCARPGPGACNKGCRCDVCSELHRQRMARMRADLGKRPRSEGPHGTLGGYRNWGCRCETCTRANTDDCRERKRARRAARQAASP